jgi:predicted RNase H-like nuclease
MATKFNWQKVTSQKRIENQTNQSRLDQKYALIDAQYQFTHIWPVGKHKGTPIKDLTTGYLIWASENLSDRFKRIADRELIVRYRQIKLNTHTQ